MDTPVLFRAFLSLSIAFVCVSSVTSQSSAGVVTTLAGVLEGIGENTPEDPDPAGLDGASIEFSLTTASIWEPQYRNATIIELNATISNSVGGAQDRSYHEDFLVNPQGAIRFWSWRESDSLIRSWDIGSGEGENVGFQLNSGPSVFRNFYLNRGTDVSAGSIDPEIGQPVLAENWGSLSGAIFTAGSVYHQGPESWHDYRLTNATFRVISVPLPASSHKLLLLVGIIMAVRRPI